MSRFVVETENVPKWDDWSTFPLLVVATDQGSDGWAAVWYLAFHLKLSAMVFPDP